MTHRDPAAQMWSEALAMLERADRLQRQFFELAANSQRDSPAGAQRGFSPAQRAAWLPPVDMIETEHALDILIALPGVSAQNVTVSLGDAIVKVVGVRALPSASAAMQIRRLEIPHGRFERHIELPPQRLELKHQELRNGCLWLSFTKLD